MNIRLRFSKHCWQYPILVTLHEKARSSRPKVFRKKVFLKILQTKDVFLWILQNFQEQLFS